MTRPIFFVKRGDRLIARLKHMFYAWRFADQIGGQVIMCWPPLPVFWHKFDGADYSPSRLFNLREFYARGGAQQLVFLEGPIGYPETKVSLRDPEFARARDEGFDRAFFNAGPSVFYEQDAMMYRFKDEPNTREHSRATLRSVFERLPLDPVFASSLEFAKTRVGGEGYVALHVRRGDVVEMLAQDLPKLAGEGLKPDRLALLMGHYVCRTALDENYFPYIDEAISNGSKILYFSDSPETLGVFAKKFGRKHFVDGAMFVGRFPIQKAYLDFNLLIGASKIVSTGSNYAVFSALLGGADLVNVAATGTVDDLERNLYDVFLKDVELPGDARAKLHNELVRQFNRRSLMRPLEANEEV